MINAKLILWIRKSALLLSQIILIFAFGCGPKPTPIIIILPTATGSPTPIVQTTETRIPAPTPTPFAARAVIKIFSHVPLSGEQAVFGNDILHGVELAVQQLNGPLSEFSYKVELVLYDDQNKAEIALANAQEIVADPEILCGVGHYDSDITIATSNIYHQARLAFIAPSATAALLTDRNYLEVNRVIGRIDGQGTAAALFAKAQRFESVYILSQKGEPGLINAEYFRRQSDSLGIQLLGMVVTDLTDANIDKLVSQIMSAQPELLYVTNSADQAIPFLREVRAAGYTGAFLGTEELNNPSMINLAGGSLLKGGSMYFTITSPPAHYYTDAAKFVQDFEARYGTPPLSYAARAYDATGICLKAIEQASKAKGGTPPTRAEVARAIRALKDYKGITGTYSFNNRGDPAVAQYYVYQVTYVDAASWDQNFIVASYNITPP